jgi:hypothetical protein
MYQFLQIFERQILFNIYGLGKLLVFTIYLSSMVDNTNWYIVISTVALVVITAYYAFQTRELARRPFTPYISASFYVPSESARDEQRANIVLDITNVGTGTATNLKVELSIPAHDITNQVTRFASMPPDKHGRLSLPVTSSPRGTQTQVHLKYEYEDIFGRKYK